MALVDKLGLSIFAMWWGLTIWLTDGACPMQGGCSDLNYQLPAAIWIVLRLGYWARQSRRLTGYAPQYWRMRRYGARFADVDLTLIDSRDGRDHRN